MPLLQCPIRIPVVAYCHLKHLQEAQVCHNIAIMKNYCIKIPRTIELKHSQPYVTSLHTYVRTRSPIRPTRCRENVMPYPPPAIVDARGTSKASSPSPLTRSQNHIPDTKYHILEKPPPLQRITTCFDKPDLIILLSIINRLFNYNMSI